MEQAALVLPGPRRLRYSPYLGELSPAPKNLLNSDVQADAKMRNGCPAFPIFNICAGKVCLSRIIDCLVISRATGARPDARLANTMLARER